MPIKPGWIVFATADCAEGIRDARAWLKGKSLTPQDVRLYRLNGQVLVETLRPCEISSDPA